MDDSVSVLMFDAAYPPPVIGGKEKQAHLLAVSLLARGMGVSVLSRQHSGNNPGKQTHDGVHVYRLRPGLFEALKIACYLVWARRRFRILHVHTPSRIGCITALLGRGVGFKVVFKIPNIGLVGNTERGMLWRLALWAVHSIVVLETESLGRLEAEGLGEKAWLIPNGVVLRNKELKGRPKNEKFCFLHVARLSAQKRTRDILRAVAQMDAGLRQLVELKIIGDGPLMADLKCLVDELRIKGQVAFIGHTEHVDDYMMNADCLVLSSEREGMPNVVLEAMACGLPVIAARVGAVPEMLEGFEQWLFKSGDIEGLVKRLHHAVKHSGEMKEYGAALHRRVLQRYDMERVSEMYWNLYKKI